MRVITIRHSVVRLAVAAAVEVVSGHLARGGLERADAAQLRPRCFGPEPARVVPGSDE
jgi:hypothetical protein